jgi:IS30 family transposase
LHNYRLKNDSGPNYENQLMPSGHPARRFHSACKSFGRRFDELCGEIFFPPRKRSRLAMTLSESKEISRSIVAGHSIRSIATTLGRSPSTVSRELRRNGGRQHYRANRADQAAWDRARRPNHSKLVTNPALARIVAGKLRALWSPEQIAGWLNRTYPDDENYQVSHETIYSKESRL